MADPAPKDVPLDSLAAFSASAQAARAANYALLVRDQTTSALSKWYYSEHKIHMKAFTRLLRLRIGPGDTDALLLRLAQVASFIVGGFVLVAGLLKVCRPDLAEAQLFGAVQQVVQTALLFCIFGALLPTKSKTTEATR